MNDHSLNEYAKKLIEQARTPAEFKVPPKAYFHHHDYAKFHVDLGGSRVKTIAFARHRYITDDKREQDQLDLVADVPGSFIYTMQDSDVDAVIRQELQAELMKDLTKASVAQAAVNNQQFDPNAPIVPVTVQHVGATPMQVLAANTGLQNSFSSSQAVDPIANNLTTAAVQTKPPQAASAGSVSAADAAAARLAEMTKQAQAS